MVPCFLVRSSGLSTYPYERPSQVQMYRDKPGMTNKSTQGVGDDNLRAIPLRWPPVTETLDLDDLTKKKNTGLPTVMTIPYKRNIQEHLLPAPSFVGSSNHLCTLFSSIYPNLVFITVSLNFQTSRRSYSKLRKMFPFFFFKKSTLLNIRRQQYENLPKVL